MCLPINLKVYPKEVIRVIGKDLGLKIFIAVINNSLKNKNWISDKLETLKNILTHLDWGLAYFSCKGPIINILGFSGHIVSDAMIQLGHWIVKYT